MRILVIGPQLSGKTTLVKYLRSQVSTPISEIDEEILKANGGIWPKDNKYKDEVLVPKIYENISQSESIIFFANYFEPISLLEQFKLKKFKVLMLKLSHEEMLKRNELRIEYEGYDDASEWLLGQLKNHEKIEKLNLVDETLDATKSTEELAELILVSF